MWMGQVPPRMGCCIEWIDESGVQVVGLVAVFVDRVERADGWSDRASVRHSRVRLPSPQTRLVGFRLHNQFHGCYDGMSTLGPWQQRAESLIGLWVWCISVELGVGLCGGGVIMLDLMWIAMGLGM